MSLFFGLLALAALYVAVLVYPTPSFAHSERFGDYRVYSDEPIPADFREVIAEAVLRIEEMEHEIVAAPRVYLCWSPTRYAFFAALTRKSPQSLAIGLSVAQSMFVSMSRVEEFADRNRGRLRHTRFEGNPAEVIAHEIAHFNSIRALGYRKHLAQPVWKSEGWAEYQANLALIRQDKDYDLVARIGQLLDDRHWPAARSLARDLWRWQLLVEYLGEVEGYGLAELSKPGVTLASASEQMASWYELQDVRVVSTERRAIGDD